MPLPKARKTLQKFAGIGAPGAGKILLFTATAAIPAVESNGLRVLTRLGFIKKNKSYSVSYVLAQRALHAGIGDDGPALKQAYMLLRRHGKEMCRRSAPSCSKCPLASDCEFYQRSVGKLAKMKSQPCSGSNRSPEVRKRFREIQTCRKAINRTDESTRHEYKSQHAVGGRPETAPQDIRIARLPTVWPFVPAGRAGTAIWGVAPRVPGGFRSPRFGTDASVSCCGGTRNGCEQNPPGEGLPSIEALRLSET
jgi:hypothetical protein